LHAASLGGCLENVKILLAAGARPTEYDLKETSFASGSEGYKLIADAMARKLPPPPPRTAADIVHLTRKDPSADYKRDRDLR
jgi:hypothetical protein